MIGFTRINQNQFEITRICTGYRANIRVTLQNGAIHVDGSGVGNISPSVFASIRNPDIWAVDGGFCVRFTFSWIYVVCCEDEIYELRELGAEDRTAFAPKKKRTTYVDMAAFRRQNKRN